MGDKVWIKVVAANLEKRQLDYEWVINGGTSGKEEKPDDGKVKKSRKKRKESSK
jgi:ribonuclease R